MSKSKKTNWKTIINKIMKAKSAEGKRFYTYQKIQKETGIEASTLSKLVTGTYNKLYYDDGLKLIKLCDSVKAMGNAAK